MREGYDRQKAYETAMSLFGTNRVKFVAIDGTESEDQEMDMLVFYAGPFGYVGNLEFSASGKGCSFSEPVEIESSISISAAISVFEQDASRIAGEATEGGIEVDSKRIPTGLMHLSEYYMAVLAVQQDPEIRVVIVDRTLAGDVGHLVWSVSEMLESGNCALLGIETEYGRVTELDLELARMLQPNDGLAIPAPRSHFIKFAAINELFRRQKEGRQAVSLEAPACSRCGQTSPQLFWHEANAISQRAA